MKEGYAISVSMLPSITMLIVSLSSINPKEKGEIFDKWTIDKVPATYKVGIE